jgi:amino acid transporter
VEQESAAGKTYIGLVLSAFALVFCVPVGILFVSVATGAVGIILGMVGYALGARRLGSLAVVLCAAVMFLGLLVGQGAIPGSYDAALDRVKEALQAPFSDPGRET